MAKESFLVSNDSFCICIFNNFLLLNWLYNSTASLMYLFRVVLISEVIFSVSSKMALSNFNDNVFIDCLSKSIYSKYILQIIFTLIDFRNQAEKAKVKYIFAFVIKSKARAKGKRNQS